ncbi:MAG TPA: TonB-dependent receptor [Pseudomonadales bacterium]
MEPRTRWVLSAAVLWLSTAGSAPATAAEPGQTGDATRQRRATPIEEVVVTARRREETLQEVPAVVQVFNNEQMFATGNDSMENLRDVVPNFQFASDMAYRSRVAVRGLGSDRSGAQTNGVGFFIDGVYQSGTARFNAPFFDVERVEVLKGPQGARYGRNSFAGVVNVVTRKPDNELRTTVQTTVENQGGLEYAGMVAGPIIEDRLYAKISGAHNESDGDFQHAVTGEDMIRTESDFYNLRLVWDVTDTFELDANLGKSDFDGIAFAFSQTTDLQDLDENFLVRDDQTSGADYEEGSLRATWSGESFEVVNRFAYRDSLTHLRVDGDVTQYDGILSVVKVDGEHISDELRIQSAGGGRLHWMFGGEYVSEDADAIFPTFFLDEVELALCGFAPCPPVAPLVGLVSSNTIESESDIWSVFGEISYEFFDRLELTVSARYDDIEKEVFNAASGQNVVGIGETFEDDELQPLFSIRYAIDDDTSVYASAAKGIREGGFNASALTKEYGIFETDEVWSYEIGLKKVFPDSGAYLNLAGFYMDADTLNQAAIILTDAGNLANGAITLGGAESYGLELDAGLPLGAGLDLTFAIGLLDCTLTDVPPFEERSPDFQQVSPGVQTGNECQDSSEWTFNTRLDGEWALGASDWTLTASVSLSGKGETRLTSDAGVPGPPTPASQRTFRTDQELQDPYYLVDVTAGVRNRHWTILAYVENLTDRLYAVDHFSHEGLADSGIFGLGEGNFITTLAPRRRYGIRLRYDL